MKDSRQVTAIEFSQKEIEMLLEMATKASVTGENAAMLGSIYQKLKDANKAKDAKPFSKP